MDDLPFPRTPVETAEHMLREYPDSRYSARQRATDHAFSHAPGPARDYWLAVLAAMDRPPRGDRV